MNNYNIGLSDGYAQAINAANVTYIFHKHSNADGENCTCECNTSTFTGGSMPETSPTKGGCYQIEIPGHYTYHQHNSSCRSHTEDTTCGCTGIAIGRMCHCGHAHGDCVPCPEVVGYRTIYDCGSPLNAGWVDTCYALDCGHSNGELVGTKLSFE